MSSGVNPTGRNHNGKLKRVKEILSISIVSIPYQAECGRKCGEPLTKVFMANEIRISTSLAWTKGGASVSGSAADTFSQVGDAVLESVQIQGVTSKAIDFVDVDDPAFILFKNQAPKADVANSIPTVTIYLGPTTPMTAMDKLIALDGQQGVMIPNGGIVWYALSTVDNTPLLVLAIQR